MSCGDDLVGTDMLNVRSHLHRFSLSLHTIQSWSVFVAELLRVSCQSSIHRYSVMSVLDWAEVMAKGAYELTDSFKLWTTCL